MIADRQGAAGTPLGHSRVRSWRHRFCPRRARRLAGWEDSAVPPGKVGAYLRDLRTLFDKFGYNPALYGHFGQGCIHCRVDFDLMSTAGIQKYRSVHG